MPAPSRDEAWDLFREWTAAVAGHAPYLGLRTSGAATSDAAAEA